jgi:hypothetical protein
VEYREDLFVRLLAGLTKGDQRAVMKSIDRTTSVKRRQVSQSAISERKRLLARQAALNTAAKRSPRH